MTVGDSRTDRSKLGRTKRHILTDKNGIPLSVEISSANAHDIKIVTDVVDNRVIKIQALPERINHLHIQTDSNWGSISKNA